MEMFRTLLDSVWNRLFSIRIPIFNISIAQLSIAVLLAFFGFSVFRRLTGLSAPNPINLYSSIKSTIGKAEARAKKKRGENNE